MNNKSLLVAIVCFFLVSCCCCFFLMSIMGAFLSGGTSSIVVNGKCLHKGELYPIKTPFKDRCNTCSCDERGFVSCTEKACEVSESSSQTSINGGSYDGKVCWNAAREVDGKLLWGSGCAGMKCEDLARSLCTQALQPLSLGETLEYQNWRSSGSPSLGDCSCYSK